jgi:hypothetical protein
MALRPDAASTVTLEGRAGLSAKSLIKIEHDNSAMSS